MWSQLTLIRKALCSHFVYLDPKWQIIFTEIIPQLLQVWNLQGITHRCLVKGFQRPVKETRTNSICHDMARPGSRWIGFHWNRKLAPSGALDGLIEEEKLYCREACYILLSAVWSRPTRRVTDHTDNMCLWYMMKMASSSSEPITGVLSWEEQHTNSSTGASYNVLDQHSSKLSRSSKAKNSEKLSQQRGA